MTGFLFGMGLIVSEMVNPQRVQGFLDLFGAWDPTLAFVMGGALCVTVPGFYFLRRRSKPLLDEKFHWPTSQDLDPRLLGGAVLFGIGWGLSGFCPGPAVTAVVSWLPSVLVFVVAMLVGMQLFAWWDRRVA